MKRFITYAICLSWCLSSSATVLEVLDLHFNYIGDNGAVIFANTINPNSTLKVLNLDDNHITSLGGFHIANLAAISGNLGSISIKGNIVGPNVGLALIKGLSVNPRLKLDFPNTGMDLNVVNVYANMAVQTPSRPHFSALGVSMPHSNFQGLLDMLRNAIHLENIDFSGCNIGDIGAIALAGMLKTNVNIKSMNLNSNGITDGGGTALAEILALMHTLESIDLTGNKFSPMGIMALKRVRLLNPNLKISFDGDVPDISLPDVHMPSTPGLPQLPGVSPKLPSWKLGKLKMGPVLADILVPHLQVPGIALKDLQVNGNLLGDMGAIKLLPFSVGLGSLDLSDNMLSGMSAPHICDFILHNPDLETLNLSLSMMGDEGVRMIAQAIGQHPKLKTLILNEVGCTDAGAAALGEALKTNMTLESLSLEGNFIKDAGAIALANGIAPNMALKSLNLGRNEIGPAGAQALAAVFVNGAINDAQTAPTGNTAPNIATISAPNQSLFTSGERAPGFVNPIIAPGFINTAEPAPGFLNANTSAPSFAAGTTSTGSFMDGDGGSTGSFTSGASTLPNVDLSPRPQIPFTGNPNPGVRSFIPPTGSLGMQINAPKFLPPASTDRFESGGNGTDTNLTGTTGGLSDAGGFE